MSRKLAPPPPQRWAFALTALAAVMAAAPLHAQVVQRARVDDKNAPVTINAEEVTGRTERQINLARDVEVVRGATRMTSDTACYKQVEDEVAAQGNVKMWRFGDRYKGDALQLNLDSGKGWILHPEYHMELNNAQGNANRIDFLNEEEAIVSAGTYSTCEGPNPDWYLKASKLRLDTGRDVGLASNTVVYFKDVPFLYTPAMSFSLSGARRSGWLSPQVGGGSKGAYELTLPYYFNIAPNRDATLSPRLILGRGLQIGANGRYIGETDAGPYAGESTVEFLLHDQQTKTDRWLLNSKHSQALAPGLGFGWNVRAASDDNYPSDFSKSTSTSAERQLLRELRTDYNQQFWSLSARVQNYQVLQDPAAALDPTLTVPRPYDRLPQINFHAGRYDVRGLDWTVDAELTRFWHPDLVRGTRATLQAQVSYPWVRPSYFVTPKLILNASQYALENNGNNPNALTRALPTFSLDSGMVFERDAKLAGRAVTQTLEPRLFYAYTPYKDQSAFPSFDSAEAGFNFAQLFSENRFLGSDRIADANQVTAAVVSRFIESDGAERLRLALGQRFYFRDQRVALDPNTKADTSRSDVLVAASGRITQAWNFDSAVQYNPSASRVASANYGVQWQPGAKKVVNLEYRYLRDSFKNVDLSTQWPIAKRWYAVARANYSTLDRKLLESLVGLEYNADCWVFRMGAQRFVTTANNTSSPFFVQLELSGLSKSGFGVGNPLQSLYQSIPGYTRLNQSQSR